MNRYSTTTPTKPYRQGLLAQAHRPTPNPNKDVPTRPQGDGATLAAYMTADSGVTTGRARRVPAARPQVQTPPPVATHLELSHGWQIAAKLSWILTALLTLGLFTASLPYRYEQLASPTLRANQTLATLHLPANLYARYTLALEITVAVVFTVVGGVIFWRKSQDAVAVVVAFMLLLGGSAMRPIVTTMDALMAAQPIWTPVIHCLTYLTWLSVFTFFCDADHQRDRHPEHHPAGLLALPPVGQVAIAIDLRRAARPEHAQRQR